LSALSTADFAALTSTQLGALTTAQIAGLDTTDLAALTTTQLQGLSSTQLAALSTAQLGSLNSLTSTVLSRIATSSLVGLSTTAIAGLGSTFVSTLSSTAFSALTTAQLDALTTSQLRALSSAQIGTLSTSELAIFTTADLVGFGSAQISALTTTQISGFATSQLMGLTTAQLAGLSSTQLAGFSTAQIGAFSMANADYLATRFASGGLTIAQIRALATSPLVLDLDDDGQFTIGLAQSNVSFDLNGDGVMENVGWASANDGLLAIDLNSDGIINDGSELFGEAFSLRDGVRAEDGFAALSSLDSNQDGKISATDNAFTQLKVWRDADSDGQTDVGELSSLMDMGIESLDLSGVWSPTAENANIVGITSSYTTTDGSTHQMADVWFRTSPTGSPVLPVVEDPNKKNIV